MLFHDLLEFALGPPPRGRLDKNSSGPCWWYNLWMRIKGPHGYMVTTHGSCEVALKGVFTIGTKCVGVSPLQLHETQTYFLKFQNVVLGGSLNLVFEIDHQVDMNLYFIEATPLL